MREIKFRVWDKVLSKFIAPEYLHLHWDGAVIAVYDNGRDVEDDTCNKDAVIQQWTGLHDRNGKEIYEGDIILESEDCWGIVVFDENANYSVFMHNVGPNEPLIDFINDSIVIGNIHENPELLGEETK